MKGLDLLGALAINKNALATIRRPIPVAAVKPATAMLTLPAASLPALSRAGTTVFTPPPPPPPPAPTPPPANVALTPTGAAGGGLATAGRTTLSPAPSSTPPPGTVLMPGTTTVPLPTPPPNPAQVAQATQAANQLLSAAKAVGSKKNGAKLAATATAAAKTHLANVTKAQASQSTKAKSLTAAAHTAVIGRGRHARVGSSLSTAANQVIDFSSWFASQAGADDSLAEMVEMGGSALDVVAALQTAGQTAAASAGQAIVDAMNNLLTSAGAQQYDDGSVQATASNYASISSQANALTLQEQQWELTAAPLAGIAPGTGGQPATGTGTTAPATAAPSISSISAPNGAPGTPLVIYGANLNGVTAVAFGGVSASFSPVSATQINTTVPPGAPTGPVTVTNPYGTASSPQTFTSSTSPNAPTIQTVIDAVSGMPNGGNPGDQITITGTNFVGVTAVSIGGVPATSFTVLSATQLSATVPQYPGSGPVTVTNQYGTGSSIQAFTPASMLSYGDGSSGYGGGSYGGGGGFGGGGDYGDGGDGGDYGYDSGGYDDGSGDYADPSSQYVTDQSYATEGDYGGTPAAAGTPYDPNYYGYGGSGGYGAGGGGGGGGYGSGGYGGSAPAPAAPVQPVVISDWAPKSAYSTGDVVKYQNNYYRATRDIESRWLFHNDTPDSTDAWSQIVAKTATTTPAPDATLGFRERYRAAVLGYNSWDPWTLLYDPAGGMYRYMNQSQDAGYQPRYVNTYWQTRQAQNQLTAAPTSRLQLAQQREQSLQSQLAARYAALAATPIPSVPPPVSPMYPVSPTMTTPDQTQLVSGEYGMSKKRKITGPALCGFAEYFSRTSPVLGLAPLGAARLSPAAVTAPGATSRLAKIVGLATIVPQKGALSHGVTVKITPAGRPMTSVHINNKVLQRRNPAAIQNAAQMAVKHAQSVATNVLNAVDKVKKQQKNTKVVGAVAPARHVVRPTSPHQVSAATLTKLQSQAKDLQKTATKLTSTATTYKKQVDSASTKTQAAIKKQKTVTKLHGMVGVDMIGVDASGLSPGMPGYNPYTDPTSPSYSPPNPSNPGYLMNGQPDPAYYGAYGASTAVVPGTGPDAYGLYPGQPGYDATSDPTSPSYGMTSGAYGATGSAVSQVPGPPDYGAGPTPTQASVTPQPEMDYVPSSDLDPQDWVEFYTSDPSGTLPNGSMGTPVPLGAIYFDGSRPLPFRGVGSATCFFNILPGGAVPKGGQGKQGQGSGYEWHGTGGFDWALVLQGSGGGYDGNKNYDKVASPDIGMISESQKNGWGPLIGQPGMQDMDGLRFDVAKMAFFWPYDKAPTWAQAPIQQAAYNAALVAWQTARTAGQADYVAAQMQDQLDTQTANANAAAQAQQDAQLALQQNAFEAQQQQQQATLDLQAQQDAEAQQAAQAQIDAQQQAADLQYQQQMLPLQVQQQQMQMQMQQQQQQMQMQMQQQGGGGYADQGYVDDGGGYGVSDQGGGGYVDPNDPFGLDDGSGGDPEGDSDAEAAAIDDGSGDGYDTVMGASGHATVDEYVRKQRLRDEGAVSGADDVINIDDYGNLVD